jgi:hypothetical protein
MVRFALLLLLASSVQAANAPKEAHSVDIDTAAEVYQAAAVREQVRASLGSMPDKIRQMFAVDAQASVSDRQLDAVSAAAKRGFQIAIFEPPALQALANNLDPATVKKSLAFLNSDLGRRMVAADVALSSLSEADIDKVMEGELKVPSTPQRDALTAKLEADTQSTESAVEIYLRIGRSIAVGTAVGAGMDPIAADEGAAKAVTPAGRAELAQNLREPLRRYVAYGYRDLSDADLMQLSEFLQSIPGKRYVTAYNAAMSAGFEAMAKRCGEQIGESWRELAQAQTVRPAGTRSPASPASPNIRTTPDPDPSTLPDAPPTPPSH